MNEVAISQAQNLDTIFPMKKWYWNTLNETILKNKLNIAHYTWHDSIFIPTTIWMEVFNTKLHIALADIDPEKFTGKNLTAFICSLMTISSWKNSQGSYVVDDYCWEKLFKKTKASIISTEQLSNINEWTIYVPLKNNTTFNGKRVYGFYAHKNNLNTYGRDKEADILIITFNTGNVSIVKRSQRENRRSSTILHKDVNPMPYAIFDITKTQSISSGFIDCQNLPLDEITPESIENFFAPYFSILNFIADTGTLIESEVVGPFRPTYRDIKYTLTYDEFNEPTFRYINPSNIRTWHVGLNFGVNYRMAVRRAKINPELKPVELGWEIDPESNKLKLIAPCNKNYSVPKNLNALIQDLMNSPLFESELEQDP